MTPVISQQRGANSGPANQYGHEDVFGEEDHQVAGEVDVLEFGEAGKEQVNRETEGHGHCGVTTP